jgi:ribokinase
MNAAFSPDAAEVFGLGQCALDYLGVVDAYPPPDVKCELGRTAIQGGGPVATALAALSRWGLTCHFAGLTGDDAIGSLIADSLRAEGVRTAGLLVREKCLSQLSFIAVEPAAGRRTIFWKRPTGPALKPAEIDLAALRRARLFYTDGLFSEAALFAARQARAAGIPVVVDAGTLREGMLDLARLSDVFIASEHFGRALAGGDDPRLACRLLAELGPSLAGVTLGKAGYVALAGGRWIEKGAYPAAAVDTTGCGDVFHAGVAYGVVRGWEAEKCLDLGAWAAAGVSRELGGRAGIPTLAALKEHCGEV